VTKETERVLRMSMLEAKLFKKTETGTEHLLLAILKDANNTAASVLFGRKMSITALSTICWLTEPG
jgi:Clp amino terminal domain.